MKFRVSILLLVSVWIGFGSIPAHAIEPQVEMKIRRGVANGALGWVEFFGGIRNDGPRGVFTGLYRTIQRSGAGVIEFLTFPVGVPKGDFSPLIQPEWPLEAWSAAAPSR